MHRLSDRVPVILLGLATVFGAVGVAEAWRAARGNSETAEAVLRDYGQVAAWTFGERALPLLEEPIFTAFLPFWRRNGTTADGAPTTVAAFRRRAVRDECGCGRRFHAAFHFRFRLGGAEPEFAGSAPANGVGAAIADAIRADLPTYRERTGMRLYGVVTTENVSVAYTLVGTGADTTAWGFSLDAEAVTERIAGVLTACSLLPPALIDDRPNREVVAIALIAPDGRALFAAGTPDPRLSADHSLGPKMGGLVVRASVLPAVAGDLIIGGLPRSRVPWMIGVFALAAILAGAAVIQLRRAQELARLRSDFVAGVSHELRTPLAQIRIYADTLALGRAETDDRRQWSVEGLRREATRLEHLVANILQFARVSRANAGTASHDPVQTLREAITSFRPLAGRRADLVLDASQGLRVRMSYDALRQVIDNLLDNAVKYGPHGQTVRVRIERVGATARLVVDDEGTGINAAERESVWEIYRRGRRVAAEVGGSGIGLAVVRRIVEGHGGRTWIDAAPSGGARVVVELPLEEPAAAPSPASAPAPAPSAPEGERTAHRVLVNAD